MADASFFQASFLGGEWSKTMQGRADTPEYGVAMNLCYNGLPLETGAWTRRPGTSYVAHTRGGAPGRIITFDFKQSAPYVLEFTDGYMRPIVGSRLATTNDDRFVVSSSTATPSVVGLDAIHGWATDNTVQFKLLGANNPVLQNRQFKIVVTSSTAFALYDAITGAPFDGSTLSNLGSIGKVTRVQEVSTSYSGGLWANLRSVQAETQAVLLNGNRPQILSVTAPPSTSADATFAITASNFLDGPYLDPYPGSQVTYSAVNGNITLTFAFQAYSSTTSYNVGDYVTSGGIGYVSLTAANAGNTPASSATNWRVANGGAPVGPAGFTAADIGRHIRLFSEPPTWAVGSTYSAGNVVNFNGGYFQSTVGSNTGVTPGTDATKWAVVSGPAFAQWTWGRVLSVSGAGLIAPSVAIGSLTSLSAAFDGTVAKNFASSATQNSNSVTAYPVFVPGAAYGVSTSVYFNGGLYTSATNVDRWSPSGGWANGMYVSFQGNYYQRNQANVGWDYTVDPQNGSSYWTLIGAATPLIDAVWNYAGPAQTTSIDAYVGQDFHSSAKTIAYATVYPANDAGFGNRIPPNFLFNLRAKHTAPSSASDGVVLGSAGGVSNSTAAITITSSDTTTAYEYVWVEIIISFPPPLGDDGSHSFYFTASIAQVEFFTPNVNNGSVVMIQLAGPPLLYAPGAVVTTWRAGAYSDSNGWPRCGAYHEGRLWLSGAIANRIDASKSNDIFNFSPTAPDGAVADDNAINYAFSASGVHAVLWMVSDERGIICGAQAGEWLVRATDQNNPLTPTNIQAHLATNNGCASIEPRRTGLTLAVVQRYKHTVLEYFADVFSGRFSSPDLTKTAKHLSTRGIEEIAYQKELFPVLWSRCTDGSLIGATYKRESLMSSQGPNFCGWHQHALGGGHTIESICVGPAAESFGAPAGLLDTLYMIALDPNSSVRSVQYLTTLFEEGAPLTQAQHLDNAITPSYTQNVVLGGVSSFQMSGLWPKNGETVSVWAGGLDLGDYLVTNGSAVVPFGVADGAFTTAFVASFNSTMLIIVGDTYTSRGQLLRNISPQSSGARNGPALGKKRRIQQFAALLVNSLGLYFGTSFEKLNKAIIRTPGQRDWGVATTFNGVHADTLKSDSTFDEMICWQITRPYPATIAAIEGFLQTQDK